jgi:hypothetical protein
VVMEAFLLDLGMPARVLETAVRGTFDTCNNNLGASHILASVASNFDIVSLCW